MGSDATLSGPTLYASRKRTIPCKYIQIYYIMISIGNIIDRKSHSRNKRNLKKIITSRVVQSQTQSDDARQFQHLTRELAKMNKESKKINSKIQILQKQDDRLQTNLIDAGNDEIEGIDIINNKLAENTETIIQLNEDKLGIRERIADINRELHPQKSIFSRIFGFGNPRKTMKQSKNRTKQRKDKKNKSKSV